MDRINQQIQYGSVIIDKPVHNDLVNMMKDHTDEVLHKHGEDSFVYYLVSAYEVSNSVKQQRKTVESFSDQVVPIHTTPIQ